MAPVQMLEVTIVVFKEAGIHQKPVNARGMALIGCKEERVGMVHVKALETGGNDTLGLLFCTRLGIQRRTAKHLHKASKRARGTRRIQCADLLGALLLGEHLFFLCNNLRLVL